MKPSRQAGRGILGAAMNSPGSIIINGIRWPARATGGGRLVKQALTGPRTELNPSVRRQAEREGRRSLTSTPSQARLRDWEITLFLTWSGSFTFGNTSSPHDFPPLLHLVYP
jgi:hypothetical protein